jgi:HSP20 family protein
MLRWGGVVRPLPPAAHEGSSAEARILDRGGSRSTKEDVMRSTRPASGIVSLKHEMDRLFERFFEPWMGEEGQGGSEWSPRLDLSETKDAVIAKLDVPGLDSKDIQVSLQEGMLTIRGEKKQEKDEKDERLHRVERRYGTFVRTIQVPVRIDASKVTAAFKNGVLTITMPKVPEAKGATIPIRTD